MPEPSRRGVPGAQSRPSLIESRTVPVGTGTPVPPGPAPWIVTLVCGASGAGKSSVAVPLARRYQVPLLEADDIVTAVQALTTPEQLPLVHLWEVDPAARTWTPARIAEHTIAVADALGPGFAAVIADHVAEATPVVITGDYLLPELAAGFGAAVRAVVIAEPDEDRIVANYRSRELEAGEQRVRAQVSVRVDAELSARAARAGVPVVAARPWSGSVDRVDAALRRAGA
jgi:2-phosphoglycerate kinase